MKDSSSCPRPGISSSHAARPHPSYLPPRGAGSQGPSREGQPSLVPPRPKAAGCVTLLECTFQSSPPSPMPALHFLTLPARPAPRPQRILRPPGPPHHPSKVWGETGHPLDRREELLRGSPCNPHMGTESPQCPLPGPKEARLAERDTAHTSPRAPTPRPSQRGLRGHQHPAVSKDAGDPPSLWWLLQTSLQPDWAGGRGPEMFRASQSPGLGSPPRHSCPSYPFLPHPSDRWGPRSRPGGRTRDAGNPVESAGLWAFPTQTPPATRSPPRALSSERLPSLSPTQGVLSASPTWKAPPSWRGAPVGDSV